MFEALFKAMTCHHDLLVSFLNSEFERLPFISKVVAYLTSCVPIPRLLQSDVTVVYLLTIYVVGSKRVSCSLLGDGTTKGIGECSNLYLCECY